MADNQKYYYMRLKENFFDSNEIKLLESLPDGYLYSNILLKLYLMSLKRNGCLMLNDKIPYNAQMIATITRHQQGTVEKALGLFEEFGLIDVMDTGAIYMLDIQSYIGKSSSEADRKRQYRERIAEEKKAALPAPEEDLEDPENDPADKCPDNFGQTFTRDRDRNRDIDREIEETPAAPPPPLPSSKEEKPKKHKYGEYKNVLLTDKELDKLKTEFSDWEIRIERLSSYMASTGKRYKSHLATIRNWAKRDAETGKVSGYGNKATRKEPTPQWVMGDEERANIDRLKKFREELRTAGNDPEIAARAENLKKQLGG